LIVIPGLHPALLGGSAHTAVGALWSQGSMADDPTWYYGTVKAILPEKGFGFVTCDESHANYGADVYLHSTQLMGLEQGMQIVFQVKVNAKGKPQAVDVAPGDAEGLSSFDQVKQAWEPLWPQQQGGKGGPGKGKKPWGPPPQRGQPLAPTVSVGESWLQVVMERGSHAGTPLVLDGIVEATGDHQGVFRAVASWLAVNSSPQASYSSAPPVRPKLVAPPPRSGPYSPNGRNTSSKSVDDAFEAALAAMPTVENGETRFEGQVSAIKQQTADGRPAFGFVKCAEAKELYGDDVFLHSTQAQELQVGQSVSFAVQVNKTGRPQAINVMIVG